MTWSHDLLFTSAVLVVTLLNLINPASCGSKWPISAPQGMLMEDKIRLGSTPPSCHNRCFECNPCMAVQVPTLPSRDQAQPGPGNRVVVSMAEESYKKYSNYKPLGWKCRCGNHLFNP